jgi:hypothetical protein
MSYKLEMTVTLGDNDITVPLLQDEDIELLREKIDDDLSEYDPEPYGDPEWVKYLRDLRDRLRLLEGDDDPATAARVLARALDDTPTS